MRRLTSSVLFVLAFAGTAALAQDDKETRSAKAILPHCAAGLAANSQDPVGGRCMGIIATLSFVSRVLPDNLKFCQPGTATPEQLLQTIGKFLETKPESVGEDFRLIALAALRDKWPCEE